ncbi:MAG TPA: PH domain-containing protein [Galbitalea sp.]
MPAPPRGADTTMDGDPRHDLLPPGAVLDTRLADGEWHRLHPATPLLRGGIFLIAIAGYFISEARQQLVNIAIGGGDHGDPGDPVQFVTTGGRFPLFILGVAVVLILIVAVFWLSWRVHEFRITDEVVEVKSGLLRRSQRKGRLDRIQGVNIVRPFFARIFGAARLEIDVAGHDANVRLDYLSSANADGLRRDILRLASGLRQLEAQGAVTEPYPRGFVEQRVNELIAPELDPNIAAPESVVKVHTGRLIGSILLHDSTVFSVLFIVLIGSVSIGSHHPIGLVVLVSLVFGLGTFWFRRFTKSLRYSIASTPDGVRVGFGLFTLSNETLPPGRIHSIQVRQPILWRVPGWWEIRVNRASRSNARGAEGQRNTTILPVGNIDDVLRVLGLLAPEVTDVNALRLGVVGSGSDGGYTNSPRRAAVVRWFSWRRNGFARIPGVVLLRRGAVWRELTIVPEPRVQSVGLHQGPLYRALGLAELHVHTVNGPVRARLGAVDRDVALDFFEDVASDVVHAVGADATHRWRDGMANPGQPNPGQAT